MPTAESRNWLVVGLGNPGREYAATRHNLGFMVVDLLAERLQIHVKREESRALIGRGEIDNQTIELAKPQTYMNLSGQSVSGLLRKPERSVERLIVISDDLALPYGTLRIREKGTHGGQNGLRSIIDCLGTNAFLRLRIGIMPEHPISQAKNFVLDGFSREEAKLLDSVLETAADAITTIVKEGASAAMGKFNQKSLLHSTENEVGNPKGDSN